MPDWNYQPYQGTNPGLLSQLAQGVNPKAASLNALTQSMFPGVNKGIDSMTNAYSQNKMADKISKILQQLRGNQSQIPQQQQGIGLPQQSDPLGLFGSPSMQAGGAMGIQGGMGLG